MIAGFGAAQAIYSDEKERARVAKIAKLTGAVCGGAVVIGGISSLIGSVRPR